MSHYENNYYTKTREMVNYVTCLCVTTMQNTFSEYMLGNVCVCRLLVLQCINRLMLEFKKDFCG